MKAVYLLFLVVFIGAVPMDSLAQHMIVLQKGENLKTRIRYKVGQPITYKQKEISYYMTDVIREIHADHIVLGDNVLSPEQIEVVDISGKDERNKTLKNLTLLPAAAGILLFTAETVNSLYSDGRISYDDTSLSIAAGLVGTSLVMSQVRYKKFKVAGKRKLLIVSQEQWNNSIK